jgi:Bifunctional DNA primase/polymerase, N-terminal.
MMVREKQTLDFALGYQKKFNLSIIPVNPKNKKPFVAWKQYQKNCAQAATIRAWFDRHPEAAIGIVTGSVSGLFVIDCDTQAGWEAIQKILPEGLKMPVAKTPRGWHLYFQYPADCTLTVGQNVIPGVDFKGEGGYVVSPPSVNSSGGCYKWIEGQSLSEVTPPTMPKAIIDLLGKFKRNPAMKKLLERNVSRDRGLQ